jgi:hypothetical protein
METELIRFKEAVLVEPDGAASCTRFDDVATRLSQEPRPFTIMLSDLWADCPMPRTKIAPMGKLLIVWFPRQGEPMRGSETEVFNSYKKSIEPIFPSATIIPAYLLQEALEDMVIDAGTPTKGANR